MKIDMMNIVDTNLNKKEIKSKESKKNFSEFLEKNIEGNYKKESSEIKNKDNNKVDKEKTIKKEEKIGGLKESFNDEENEGVSKEDEIVVDEKTIIAILLSEVIALQEKFEPLKVNLENQVKEEFPIENNFDFIKEEVESLIKQLNLPEENIITQLETSNNEINLIDKEQLLVVKENFLGNKEQLSFKEVTPKDLEKIKEFMITIEDKISKEEIGEDFLKIIENIKELIVQAEETVPSLKPLKNDNFKENSFEKENLNFEEVEVKREQIDKSFTGNEFSKDKSSSDQSEKEEAFLSKLIGTEEDSSKNIFITNKFQPIEFNKVEHLEGKIEVKTFSTDVVKNVKLMINNSIKELVVKVNPGNLGEVTIKLSMVGNEMKANLSTNSKELYNYININEIKNHLASENIKISEVDISLYQEDTTFFNEEKFRENKESYKNSNYKNQYGDLEEEENFEVDELSALDIII